MFTHIQSFVNVYQSSEFSITLAHSECTDIPTRHANALSTPWQSKILRSRTKKKQWVAQYLRLFPDKHDFQLSSAGSCCHWQVWQRTDVGLLQSILSVLGHGLGGPDSPDYIVWITGCCSQSYQKITVIASFMITRRSSSQNTPFTNIKTFTSSVSLASLSYCWTSPFSLARLILPTW